MGGGERRKINTMASDQANRVKSYGGDVSREAQDYRSMGQGMRERLMPQLTSGWESMMDTSQLNSLFGGDSDFAKRGYSAPKYNKSPILGSALGMYKNMFDTGGIDQSAFNSSRDLYKDFATSGGLDPALESSITGIAGQLRDFGTTGGNISAEDKARMRGLGVYDEFAKTGGLSDADRANIRSRGTSGIPAAFQRASEEANRMRSVQGGYGPGASALGARMSRGATQDAADASLNAELGITDRVNSGRLAGAAGASSTEQALQSLISSNTLAGLSGAGGLTSGLAGMKQSGREFGISGGSNLEQSIQNMMQRGRMFGASGTESLGGRDQDTENRMSESTADAANRNVNRLDDRDRYLYEGGMGQRLAGLGGLSSLYNMGPSGMERYGDEMQRGGMEDQSSQMLPYLQFMSQMNPSFMQQFGSILGGAGAAAGGIGGLAGAFTGRRGRR